MNYKLKTRKAASKPYAVAYGTRGAEPEVTWRQYTAHIVYCTFIFISATIEASNFKFGKQFGFEE